VLYRNAALSKAEKARAKALDPKPEEKPAAAE
jgi:hypothetical protein